MPWDAIFLTLTTAVVITCTRSVQEQASQNPYLPKAGNALQAPLYTEDSGSHRGMENCSLLKIYPLAGFPCSSRWLHAQ